MATKPILRPATERDLEDIIRLGEMLQNDSKEFESDLVFNFDESLQHYRDELTNKNALIVIAMADDRIIGYQYSFINMLDYLASKNIECTFEAVYVLSEWRSQGIGEQLVNYSEDWAINDKKVDRLRANIYSGNKSSEGLHLKHGFTPYNVEYVRRIA